MSNTFRALMHNYVLTSAALSWFIAQIIKTIIVFFITNKFDKERLVGSGGMPSSHSAAVCALAMAASRQCGFNSAEFAIACIFAAVVMYDAIGVRRSAGEQAKVLNRLILKSSNNDEQVLKQEKLIDKTIKKLKQKQDSFDYTEKDEDEMKKLKEILGHNPMEVLAGALLGIMVALIIPMR